MVATMLGGGAALGGPGVIVGGGASISLAPTKRQGVGSGVGAYPLAAAMPGAAAAPYAVPVPGGAAALPMGADVMGMPMGGGLAVAGAVPAFDVGAAIGQSFQFRPAD